jgi:hypothetical protein
LWRLRALNVSESSPPQPSPPSPSPSSSSSSSVPGRGKAGGGGGGTIVGPGGKVCLGGYMGRSGTPGKSGGGGDHGGGGNATTNVATRKIKQRETATLFSLALEEFKGSLTSLGCHGRFLWSFTENSASLLSCRSSAFHEMAPSGRLPHRRE